MEEEAERLLTSIEHRIRYLSRQSRRTIELFFGQVDSGPPEAGERLDIAQIERFAPQWAAAVPPTPELRGALAHAMSSRYGPGVTQPPLSAPPSACRR
jgi:hypothetical protein